MEISPSQSQIVAKKLQDQLEILEQEVERLLDLGQLPTKLLAELQEKRKALEFSLKFAG